MLRKIFVFVLCLVVSSILIGPALADKPMLVGMLHDGQTTRPNWGWASVPPFYMALDEVKAAGINVTDILINTYGVSSFEVQQYAQDLIDAGAIYINSGMGSANTKIAVENITGPQEMILGGACSSSSGLTGLPYFFRTHAMTDDWGPAGAYYAQNYDPYQTLSSAAVIYRNDSFGKALLKGFVLEEARVIGDVSFEAGDVQATFEGLIPDLVDGNPEIVAGTWGIGELKEFLKAWAAVEAAETDPDKKAYLESVQFIHMGSVRTDYSGLPEAAINILAERSVGIQPHYDPDSKGYINWFKEFEAFDPAHKYWQDGGHLNEIKVMDANGEPLFRHALASYDATMIYFLAREQAIAKGSEDVYAEICSIANPDPGNKKEVTIYPGDFSKARQMIGLGKEINYEGASSPCDVNALGDIRDGIPYLSWSVNSDGTVRNITAFTPILE